MAISIYYYTSISNTLISNLTNQADQSIERTRINLEECLEDYRHRLYLLSNDETISDALLSESAKEPKVIYQQLYSIMKGKIYDASAHIVSIDGKIRYSTHEFPPLYDFRYNNNDNSFNSILKKAPDSIMVLMERYINSRNDTIMLNLVRKVTDKENNLIGYVIIDIFAATLTQLYNENIFSDLLIINTDSLIVESLIHTGEFGNFSRFPALLREKNAENRSIFTHRKIEEINITLVGIVETDSYTLLLNNISLTTSVIMIACILTAFLVSFLTSKHITKPVDTLVSAMKQVEQGDLHIRIDEQKGSEEIMSLNKGFNEMVIQIEELIALTKEEERQLRVAERKSLQAQINPHFLYNTLYTIKAIAKLHGEKQILTISTELGKLFRNAMSNKEDEVSLAESMELVESFLSIQKIRFPKKLNYICTIDEKVRNIRTPKLIIQPFVENAISHGLEPMIGKWELVVKVESKEGRVFISIEDNGIGFDEISITDTQNDHIGITNVKRRLELYYESRAVVRIKSLIGKGTKVTIILPSSKDS